METLACPVCNEEMDSRALGDADIHQCPAGHGVFLRRADLGTLADAERAWHQHAGHHTMPMPRITADMAAPPVTKPAPRSWIETLFG
jgi:Zn-finger nucleic acid-binding protein